MNFWKKIESWGAMPGFLALVASVLVLSASTGTAQSDTSGEQELPLFDPPLEPPLVQEEPQSVPACNEQTPQPFLIRSNYIRIPGLTEEQRQQRREAHQYAIRYRTEQYGYFEGFGDPSWNDTTPEENSEYTTFMGLRVQLDRRIIPALRCVEEEIHRSCSHVPYQPHRLSGLRTRNTFHTGEVSNHVYGIAIDIDPDRNTCCHCTARWREHPLCQIEVDSIFERMAMPECWVHAFERYGFYWLGWDPLEDTMHFEFLGDPDRISRDLDAPSDSERDSADGVEPP